MFLADSLFSVKFFFRFSCEKKALFYGLEIPGPQVGLRDRPSKPEQLDQDIIRAVGSDTAVDELEILAFMYT